MDFNKLNIWKTGMIFGSKKKSYFQECLEKCYISGMKYIYMYIFYNFVIIVFKELSCGRSYQL